MAITYNKPVLLTLNAGSASLKFSLFTVATLSLQGYGQVEILDQQLCFTVKSATGQQLTQQHIPYQPPATAHDLALNLVLSWLKQQAYQLVAAGHRIVHGADQFTHAVKLTPQVVQQLAELIPLAPLHQPQNLMGIEALAKQCPELLQVACFDTAFHHTQPAIAQMEALPAQLDTLAIKRYGFHGLSYAYIAQVLPRLLATKVQEKVIVAHLGHGASLCALYRGHSIATSMGFTALDGLPMGTRCGSIDPGIILYLLAKGYTLNELTELLYQHSGLLGVSGISSDVRVLAASKEPAAKEALALFVYRIQREIGSLAAALGGLNGLVFTAGIGEHASFIRSQVCQKLAWLGIELDSAANEHHQLIISKPSSSVWVAVIPTQEEVIIAQQTKTFCQ